MNATMEKNTTNGINTTSQKQIMTALAEQTDLAKVTFKAGNEWKGVARTRSELSSFYAAGQEHAHNTTHVIESDLPDAFLGEDHAPTPGEFALHALAACMNSTMVYNCAARGITVRSSRVRIEGDLDAQGFLRLNDEVNAGFQQIRIEFTVDADAPAEEIQNLLEGTPMFNTFARPVSLSLNLKMV